MSTRSRSSRSARPVSSLGLSRRALVVPVLAASLLAQGPAAAFWNPPGSDPCDNPFINCWDGGEVFDYGDDVGESIDDYASNDIGWGFIYWFAWFTAPKVVPPEHWPPGPGGDEEPPGGGPTDGGGEGGPTDGGEDGGPTDGGGSDGPTDGGGGPTDGGGGDSDDPPMASTAADTPWLAATVMSRELVESLRKSYEDVERGEWQNVHSGDLGSVRTRLVAKYEFTPDPSEYTINLLIEMKVQGDSQRTRVRFPVKIESKGEMVRALVETDSIRWSHQFRRGDGNRDGTADITDAILGLEYLFLGVDQPLTCPDALDVDDNGLVELTDTIALLNFLFLDGEAPRPPFDAPDFDPTDDGLDCL